MILESGILSASNLDVLSVGRLNALPYNGQLTMQFLASKADAANFASLTIQQPNGDVPIDNQLIPGSSSGAAGVLYTDELLQTTFRATQGGHFTVSVAKTGTVVVAYRFILRP